MRLVLGLWVDRELVPVEELADLTTADITTASVPPRMAQRQATIRIYGGYSPAAAAQVQARRAAPAAIDPADGEPPGLQK